MGSEKIGRKVKVEATGTIMDYDDEDKSYFIEFDNGVEGWFGGSCGFEPEIESDPLPTAEGSVIRITRWHGQDTTWSAIRVPSGWQFSCDPPHETSAWGDDTLQEKVTEGYMEYEVIYSPEEGNK